MQNDFIALRGLRDLDLPRIFKTYEIAGYPTIIHFSKDLNNYNLEPMVKKLNIKTLIIAGDNDTIVPLKVTKALHKDIPGSKLIVYKGINHQPTLNNWKQYKEDITNFLISE